VDTGKVMVVADRLQQIAVELARLQKDCLIVGAGDESPYDLVVTGREQIGKVAAILLQAATAERAALR